jgi:hypothetical protein
MFIIKDSKAAVSARRYLQVNEWVLFTFYPKTCKAMALGYNNIPISGGLNRWSHGTDSYDKFLCNFLIHV